MPVMVTAGERAAGRAFAAALLRAGGEVRVFLDAGHSDEENASACRAAGYKTARGTLDDEGHLELALQEVHTVVHAGGEPLDDPAGVLDDAAGILSAAIGAGCRRFVWASQLAVTDPGGNLYLEACAEVEELLASAPLETVVIRRALTYGPGDPLTAALAGGALARHADVAGTRHLPLYVQDLAAAVVAADRERQDARERHVILELAGPDAVTLADFARLLGARRGRRGPGLPAHVLDLLARGIGDVAPGTDGGTDSGVVGGVARGPTALATGVAAVLARA
jgi:uncharacterized protein YbjT (DUF2867 family)